MRLPWLRGLFMASLVISGASAASGVDPTPSDDLAAWAQARVATGESGAIVIARIHGDGVTVAGFGHRTWPDGPAPDGDTRFLTGSIGKVFTHLLLAERVADGAVAYSQSLGSLLPEGVTPRNPALAAIMLQALATHHSGLPRLPPNFAPTDPADPYAGYDATALWAAVEQTRDRQRLGSYYGYSNFAVGLLGQLLADQAGSDYFAAVAEHVAAPLGMTDTGRDSGDNHAVAVSSGKAATAWSNHDALVGAGGLWGSANDLVRLLQAYLGRHEHRLKHDLDADLEIVGDSDEGMSVTRVWHVATAGGQPIYWHNGGTMTHWGFAGFRPDTGQGLVVLTSGDADPTLPSLLALGHAPSGEPAPEAALDTTVLGQYQLDDTVGVGVVAGGGRLRAKFSGQGELVLHPVGEDWYALHEVDASVRFQRDGDVVVALEFVRDGIGHRAGRVADRATASEQVEVDLPVGVFAQYVGRYAFAPGVEFSIRERDGGLEAMLTGQTWLPIHAAGEDRFFYRAVDASLQFGRDEAGAVDALTLHQGALVQRAPRIAEAE